MGGALLEVGKRAGAEKKWGAIPNDNDFYNLILN